jgi:integrase
MHTVSLKSTTQQGYKWLVRYPDGQTRKKSFFKTKTAAKEFQDEKIEDLKKEGAGDMSITSSERRAVLALREAIAKLPNNDALSLEKAVTNYIELTKLSHKSIHCSDVAKKLLDKLEIEGKSQRHRDTVKSITGAFNETYGDRLACDISTDIINDYLTHLGKADTTKRNHRRVIHQLFSHAVEIGSAQINPVTKALKIKRPDTEAGILTPEELASLLSHADEVSLPPLAISFFAGLRRAEIEKIDWRDIHVTSKEIVISAKIAKTGKRRIVTMSDNLAAWLTPLAKKRGLLVDSLPQWRKSYEAAREAAGITDWPPNAARHSYVSYHLAFHEDQGKTALQVGHTSAQILHEHYKALVTKGMAKTYWSISPTKGEKITNIKSA